MDITVGDAALSFIFYLQFLLVCHGVIHFKMADAVLNWPRPAQVLVAADTYELWWPVGYGGQPLYPFAIAYTPAGNGTANSTLVRNVGFRTMELVREPRTETFTMDVQIESFFFRVNGVPIFARGALPASLNSSPNNRAI